MSETEDENSVSVLSANDTESDQMLSNDHATSVEEEDDDDDDDDEFSVEDELTSDSEDESDFEDEDVGVVEKKGRGKPCKKSSAGAYKEASTLQNDTQNPKSSCKKKNGDVMRNGEKPPVTKKIQISRRMTAKGKGIGMPSTNANLRNDKSGAYRGKKSPLLTKGDCAEGQEDPPEETVLSQQDEKRRRGNIKALLDGSLEIHRNPLIPKLLSVRDEAAVILRRPFKSPLPNAPNRSEVSYLHFSVKVSYKDNLPPIRN